MSERKMIYLCLAHMSENGKGTRVGIRFVLNYLFLKKR